MRKAAVPAKTGTVEPPVDLGQGMQLNAAMADSLRVELGERSYAITFGREVRPMLGSLVTGYQTARRPLAVVTDRNVAAKWAAQLDAVFGTAPRFVADPGEGAKSMPVLGQLLEFLATQRIDRAGVVFAVGGGVVGDLAGFAAAAFLRGIEYVQVPTTLLAMVDSSVGGKTGINLTAGKNLAGAFHQPKAVVVATEFLATLPPREFAAGMAEVIKYGLLGERALFEELAAEKVSGADDARLPGIVRRCCAAKAAIVQADEREVAVTGGRALLNLGHTFGHAIEQVTGYKRYLHGEGVAVGLAAAARLSVRLGLLPAGDVSRIEAAVTAHGLPVRLEPALPLAALMEAMQRDKKVRAGRLRFVVLAALGEACTHDDVPAEAVEAVWREIEAS